MSAYKDMTVWDNIFIEKYVSTIMHHMLRTGTNISHRKLEKQKVQQFYGISLFIQTEQYKQINQTYKRSQRKACKLIDFTFLMDINISAKKLENYQNIKISRLR